MAAIDLNADAGESADTGTDEALLEVVTSVSLACGVHAGSEATIAHLSAAALARGVGVGAHPGLASGRKAGPVSPAAAAAAVRDQVQVFRRASRAPLQHVKLHGHLYHAARDPLVARAVVEAVIEAMQGLGGAVLVAQAGSPLLHAARAAGLRVAGEAFLDRAYEPTGLLVPRGRTGAIIEDPQAVAARAVQIALAGQVRAADGSALSIAADTLCVHGDTPGAPFLAASARRALEAAGVELRPMGAA